jgi:hypothetical protein
MFKLDKRDGLLKKPRKSKKYVPDFMETERIKAEALKIDEEKGKEEGVKKGENMELEKGGILGINEGSEQEKIKIAKKALIEEHPLEYIANLTGLTEKQIKDLQNENKLN